MGLFSSKKKVYVSSTLYNLAGDVNKRVQYLPTTVVTKIISQNTASLGEAINNSLLNGPGVHLRNFCRWAINNGYMDKISMVADNIVTDGTIDANVLIAQTPHNAGEEVTIQTASIGQADYGFWADQYMLDNHKEQADADYEVDFTELTNTVYIRFTDGTFYSFQPAGFDSKAEYLYYSYNTSVGGIADPVQEGTVHDVDSPADLPDTSDWELQGTTLIPKSVVLHKTVLNEITYSDGRPAESNTSTTDTPTNYNDLTKTWVRTDYNGITALIDQITSTRRIQVQNIIGYVGSSSAVTTKTETISGGVTKTTKTTTTTESLKQRANYRNDTQRIVNKRWYGLKVVIYKRYSGNPALDALFDQKDPGDIFFPFIPMRANNTFISETVLPDLYAANKKALKKATGAKYDSLVDSLKANDNIGDIDFAYICFGVSLNVQENSCKKYLYKFFQNLFKNGQGGTSKFNAWKISWNEANNSTLAWNSWKAAQADSTSPLYGSPEPTKIPYPSAPYTYFRVSSSTTNYNMAIGWSAISETVIPGLMTPTSKRGDVILAIESSENYPELVYSSGQVTQLDNQVDFLTIKWQDEIDSYRVLGIWGLGHNNMIYDGKSVYTIASAAMADPEESGFIVPLHQGIYTKMSLKDATQMSTACSYMVLNSYKVVKQKWYSSSWFKIVLIIVVIVVTVLSAGSGGASAGLLGTAASVGAALGFAGVVAIIVGSIANAIAAMLLSQIIMSASNQIFGEKVGAVIGAIASVVAVSVGTSMANGGGIAGGFSSLSNAENLTKLTVAAGKGFAGYVNADTALIQQQTQELMASYNSELTKINAAYAQNLGTFNSTIDVLDLTDSAVSYIAESSSTFLNRTLMTGSDIADTTNSMLTNFASVTTSTELPS